MHQAHRRTFPPTTEARPAHETQAPNRRRTRRRLVALVTALGLAALGLAAGLGILASGGTAALAAPSADASLAPAAPAPAADVPELHADVGVEGLDMLWVGESNTVTVEVTVTDQGSLADDQHVQVLGVIDPAIDPTIDSTSDPTITAVASIQPDGSRELALHDGAFLFPTADQAPTVADLRSGQTFILELTVSPQASAGELDLDVSLVAAPSPPTSQRLFGDDRFHTAVAISTDQYPQGADTVYLARGDAFPDALAVGPVAAAADAPLLLSDPEALPAVTADELVRLDPDEVVLLGGEAALSQEVAEAIEDQVGCTSRVFGADRVETAAEIARSGYESADTALLATAETFPDALAGVPAAFALDAPVLLSDSDELSAATREVIAELGAQEVIVLGGEGALSATVARDLEAVVERVERVAGADRFATSARVALELFEAEEVDRAFLATGWNFPDALAGGPVAARQGAPLLLTGNLPGLVAEALGVLAPADVVALGGPAVLGEDDLAIGVRASTRTDDPGWVRSLSGEVRHRGAIVRDDDAETSPDPDAPEPAALAFDEGVLAPPDESTMGEEHTVAVRVLDEAGDPVTDVTDIVSLALFATDEDGEKAEPVDEGLAAVAATDGVATFEDLVLGEAGEHVLHATVADTAVDPATSEPITVWPEGELAEPTDEVSVEAGTDEEWVFEVDVAEAPLAAGESIDLEWQSGWAWDDTGPTEVLRLLDRSDAVAFTIDTEDVSASPGLELAEDPLVDDAVVTFTATDRLAPGTTVEFAFEALHVEPNEDVRRPTLLMERTDSGASAATYLKVQPSTD